MGSEMCIRDRSQTEGGALGDLGGTLNGGVIALVVLADVIRQLGFFNRVVGLLAVAKRCASVLRKLVIIVVDGFVRAAVSGVAGLCWIVLHVDSFHL